MEGAATIADGIMYISSSDGMVYALDTNLAGIQKWRSERLADRLWTGPVVMGEAVYVTTLDGRIYGLSREDGELLEWFFEAEAGFASPPAIYRGVIYAGSFDRRLYAVEIGSNVSMWTFPVEGVAGSWFWARPVVSEGVVYAGCLDGKLYAIEAETGEKLWEFDTGDPIVASPVLMDNSVVVASEAGNVYVVNLETGEGERIRNPENDDRPTIGARIRASFCVHNGLAYIRAEDNKLYVVDITRMRIAEGWPLSLAAGR